MRQLRLAAVLCLLTAAPLLAQTTIHVGPPPDAYQKIQDAINAASNGDTVLVDPGTYYENLDFKGKAITVTSAQGAAVTILDGSHNGTVVTMKTSEPRAAVLSNFTITHGGMQTSTSGAESGGGILVQNSQPTILNNIITQNYCQGIRVEGAAPLIQGNTVSHSLTPQYCTVLETGGIYLGNPYLPPGSFNTYVSAQVIGNTIEDNTTGQSGDGGGDGGAGIAIWGGAPLIENNIIRNNTTISGSGGGINIVYGDNISIVQNLIYGNTAGCGGGAIGSEEGSLSADIYLLIVNNTIVDNTQYSGGGGYSDCLGVAQFWTEFSSGSGPSIKFINNIVSGNTTIPSADCGYSGYNTTVSTEATQSLYDHNLLYNAGGLYFATDCTDTTHLNGNISANPQFMNAAGNDYRLQSTSPAIDAGNGSALAMLAKLSAVNLTQDFAGSPRELDATGKGWPVIDMGAYEFGGSADGAPTRVILTPSAYTGSAGSNYSLTATLSSGLGMPTGQVSFSEDGQPIGTAAIQSGLAVLNNVLLKPGVHKFLATYAGQGAFPSAVSVVEFVSITPYATTLLVAGAPNPASLGQNVTFTVKVSSADTGFVPSPITLTRDFTTTLATLTPDASGTATYSTSSLTVGSHPIIAYYAGDTAHAAASYSIYEVINDPNTTTTVVKTSGTPSIFGTAVIFTATTTSAGGATPTGSMSFYDGGTLLQTLPVDFNGASSLSISTLTVGYHTISATFVPTGTFKTSSGTVFQQVINGYTTSTAITSSLNPSLLNQSVTFTAHVTSTNGTPTGSVAFTNGSNPLGSQTLDSSGNAAVSTSTLTRGTHTITATYTPTGTFAGSSNSLQQVVNGYDTTTVFTSAQTTANYGDPITLAAQAAPKAPSATPLSGTIQFFVDAVAVSPAIGINGSGAATYTLPTPVAAGTHIITCAYSGDTTFNPSSCTGYTITIAAEGTTAVLTTPDPATAGKSFRLVAQITSANGIAPVGNVTFYDGTPALAIVPVSGGNPATFTLASLAAGSHSFTCKFIGSANFQPATCNTVPLTVTLSSTTLTLGPDAGPWPALAPRTFVATLTSNNSPVPAEPIVLSVCAGIAKCAQPMLFSSSTSAQGQASFTVSGLYPGTYFVQPMFAGDTTYAAPSINEILTQTVVLNPTTTTLIASPNPAPEGTPVTFVVSVLAATGTVAPQGTVTLMEAGGSLGSLVVNPATGLLSSATFTLSNLAAGTHTLSAIYTPGSTFSGQTAFVASQTTTDTSLVITPLSFTLTSNPTAISIQTEHHGALSLTLTPIGNFNGFVQLSCGSNLPPVLQCEFAHAQIVLNGTAATSSLTLETDAIQNFWGSLAPQRNHTRRNEEIAFAALLPLALLGLTRKRRRLSTMLLALCLLPLTTTLLGCGNKWPDHTPAGTYDIAITATGTPIGSSTVVKSTVHVSLTVTP